jgi:hypothetical protein
LKRSCVRLDSGESTHVMSALKHGFLAFIIRQSVWKPPLWSGSPFHIAGHATFEYSWSCYPLTASVERLTGFLRSGNGAASQSQRAQSRIAVSTRREERLDRSSQCLDVSGLFYDYFFDILLLRGMNLRVLCLMALLWP